MSWNILYRGPLSSCNYACDYCPFAKTKNTRSELADDARKLQRFIDWVKTRNEDIEILFAPWGEALIRKYYQEAMVVLSHLPNVKKVTIQTNLTCKVAWMKQVNRDTFSLWTTFHPSQITMDEFVVKCNQLDKHDIPYTVGFVALKEDISILEKLRYAIPENIYIWANAYKRIDHYYSSEDIQRITKVDPLFHLNNQIYDSEGKPCRAGHTSFSVDGEGNITRCNFIKDHVANIYEDGFEEKLKPTKCTNEQCRCYIGYVHLEELGLDDVYDGVWGRRPFLVK